MNERVAKSKCEHYTMDGRPCIVSIWDYVKLPTPIGAFHGFEWHDYMGPSFCGRSGKVLKSQPGERHPVWDIFDKWLAYGKLVDKRGYAVLPPITGKRI